MPARINASAACPLQFALMTRHIPNIITLFNLFFGCCALLFTWNNEPVTAAWCTAACFGCDYLDGMLARALNVHSPLGKQLDSLADVVSFGVVPGAMMYKLLEMSLCNGHGGVCIAALPAFGLSMISALRLGKFNLDTRQTDYFIGLTTPACTVFVLGFSLAVQHQRFGIEAWALQPVLLYVLTAVLSVLLITEIPMLGMKIKKFDLAGLRLPLLFIGVFLVAVWFLKELALPAIIVFYIVYSIVFKHEIFRGN